MQAMTESITSALDGDGEPTPSADPYRLDNISIANLYTDPDVQRAHTRPWDEGEWDWKLCEPLTVSPSAKRPGMYLVLEGQRRHARLSELGYDGMVPCRLLDDVRVKTEQARVGRSITISHRPMKAPDDWNQLVRSGNRRFKAVDRLLRSHGLAVAAHPSFYTIAAADALRSIVNNRSMTNDSVVEHVDLIVTTIIAAWPQEDLGNRGERWNGNTIKMLDRLIRKNVAIDLDKVAAVMRKYDAATWVSQAKNQDRRSVDIMGGKVEAAYNKSEKLPARKLKW